MGRLVGGWLRRRDPSFRMLKAERWDGLVVCDVYAKVSMFIVNWFFDVLGIAAALVKSTCISSRTKTWFLLS